MKGSVFKAYSRYYNLLYSDKDYESESKYIMYLLKRNGVTQGNILEFGSGTGKHGRLLSKLGFKVHGIEQSEEMFKLAEQDDGFTCEIGDVCNIKLNRQFDCILSLFHVASYQIENSRVQAFFDRAAEHLLLGGLFVFDAWYSPAVYNKLPTIRIKRMEDKNFDITRIAEPTLHPSQNKVDVHYNIFVRNKENNVVETIKETHSMRHFTLPELDFFAQMSGFKRIETEEFLTGKPHNEETWGVCHVFKKVGRGGSYC
jgi:SAM-dependent methyltransferase